tara:strand:- start:732 stop:1109 length:378 start_codon:yes stop_codon:yes gene_type:complete
VILEKIFKRVIIFKVIILGAGFITALNDPYDVKYAEQASSPILTFAVIVSLLGTFSLLLLYKFVPSGRIIYTLLVALWLLVLFLSPESYFLRSRTFDTLNWINGAATGVIFAILYLTEIKEKFVR